MSAIVAAVLALIVAVTGIDRAPDAQLAVLAQQRAVETTRVFDHRWLAELDGGRWAFVGEVIHYNDAPDVAGYAVDAWRRSPSHWAVLTDRRFTRIGCAAAATADGLTYIVCVLGQPTAPLALPDTATAP